MSEANPSSYDDVPYPSQPFYPSHPDCLATVAMLHGMQPAPIDRCRVLELGCANGGNLIPMAESLGASQFVGIDLSPVQIASGQAMINAVGLKNIDLRAVSILDVDERFGKFDYILCHGVYSWVPPEVQDKILDICKSHLSPQGVAYISYNTYPGWHERGMVREMMNFHAQQFAEPDARVQQARSFLDFLIESVPDPESAYHQILKKEADLLRPESDYYLFHEHLEDFNQPCYFHQFAERSAAKRLQYLGESWVNTTIERFSPAIQAMLLQLSSDIVDLEQYYDFLVHRTFRRTLLCHDDIPLTRIPSAKTVAGLYVGARAREVPSQTDSQTTVVEEFRTDDGTTISTNIPVLRAALLSLLDAWPAVLSFDALWTAASARLTEAELAALGGGGREKLAESLLHCHESNVVAFHSRAPQIVLEAGPVPLASALARRQAETGAPITNLRHRVVELSEIDRVVLCYLDGTRDRRQIQEALAEVVTLEADDEQGVVDEGSRERAFGEALRDSLKRLGRSALLLK